ncbi:MAG: hypothetical protein Ct9H300mP14_03610 [Gammaproteobacteria bacterium]|nr:MAG: hypothetical protein Ct9H300mP14_03610 [Gammaproteobacteria bacterium]
MIEHNFDISTDDGQMATFITHPEPGGPHPVVLFLIDAPGKREKLHDMARRISATATMSCFPIFTTAMLVRSRCIGKTRPVPNTCFR